MVEVPEGRRVVGATRCCRIDVKALEWLSLPVMANSGVTRGAAMQTKFIALLIAGAALSGCCASGTGCSTTPTASSVPIAWDGLGEAPSANDEPGEQKSSKRRTARNREIILGPLNATQPKQTQAGPDAKARYDEWTRLPSEDRETDARLARQLKICRDC
jgi:hypothetical protein